MSDSVSTKGKATSKTARVRAGWYVVVFHYQMAALTIFMSIAFILVPGQLPAFVPIPAWAMWLLAALGVPITLYVGIDTLRYTRWLQGHGNHNHPLLELAPPTRLNCAAIGLAGLCLIGIGFEIIFGAQGNPLFALFIIPAGLAGIFVSACGFLWARDVARKAN